MKTQDASVAIFYKNFAIHKHISHIGLGISGMNNQKVLRQLGLRVDVDSITSAHEIRESLKRTPRTHVVISAPWIPTTDLQGLCLSHPDTTFFLNSHSNIGFLQADRNGVKLLREAVDLQTGTHNFHVAGNSKKFVTWMKHAMGVPCAYLPNCYYLDGHTQLHRHTDSSSSTLRIGVFGATRPLKNMMSAAGAALEIARDLRRPLEFWVSTGRAEGGGDTIMQAIQNLFAGLPGVEIKMHGWQAWPNFRRVIGQMHLLLQPSYTESFNIVTADGISMGVPSVVGEAIDWVPDYWQANVDDVVDISRVGKHLLSHRQAPEDGLHALIQHNAQGSQSWGHAFGITDLPHYHVPHKSDA